MFKKLFGGSPPRKIGALGQTVRALYPRLVLDVDVSDIAQALEAWAWLEPPAPLPDLIVPFGDMFFDTPLGVIMLDTMEGALNVVADSAAAFVEALDQDHYRDEILGDVWVQAASRRGLVLAPGESFDWTIAPILGGRCSVEAITKGSFVVNVNIAGQLHRQIKALPPGTPIGKITISD